MKFSVVTAALVALLPSLGSACAAYGACLCQNADGSFNDDATKAACANFAGNYNKFDDGRHYCGARAVAAGVGGGVVLTFNNCRFRQVCNRNGAAGDSNCWSKA